MTEHYYTKRPDVASDRHTWSEAIGGQSFSWTTDAGVFSKTQLDFGSKLLAETAAKTSLVSGPVLDLGCGYGPIGLYIARQLPERSVQLVDINERATGLAAENAAANGVENVAVYPSDAFSEVAARDFALIVTNPPIRAGKKLVHHMLSESFNYLAPGGKLQIVIQKKQGAPSARKKMAEVFGNVERVALEKGYWILESVKE